MRRFTVRYERDADSGWWVAQIREAPAAITQGRTIAEARRRIREALALALADDEAARTAKLIDDVKLPADARRALNRAREARRRLDAEAGRAQAFTAVAVRKLIRYLSLSVRDTGELLGISHQRVQQLVRRGEPLKRPKKALRLRLLIKKGRLRPGVNISDRDSLYERKDGRG